jgi:hypothetical protein
VRLTLATDPGPDGDGGGDWAGWGDVRVIAAEDSNHVLLVPIQLTRSAWQYANLTADSLFEQAGTAFKDKKYNAALKWYERGALMGGRQSRSIAFRFAISAIMSTQDLPDSVETSSLSLYSLDATSRIEAEKLHWLLQDSYWNIEYGNLLLDHPSGDKKVGVLWWGAPAIVFVDVGSGGDYRVVVRAKHSISGLGNLYVGYDFSSANSFPLTSDWRHFRTIVRLSPGVHIICLRYEQLAEDIDGDAILDWIFIEKLE